MTGYHYRAPQELHLLSILAQTASRRASGCLRVADSSNVWMLYLEQGRLIHAYNSLDPFGRLDRYLRRLNAKVPSLASPVRVQVRLLFQKPYEDPAGRCSDYEAICWLVEQQYLTDNQAAQLVEAIAKEVLESLLPLQIGNYDLLADGQLGHLPRFCHLDLRTLVEACQVKRQRQQFAGPGRTTARAVSSPQPRQRPIPPPPTVMPSKLHRPVAPLPPANTVVSPPQMGKVTEVPEQKIYTIACIDDSPTVLSAIESFLDDKAFKVLRIDNPVSALMKIIRNKPDLILLDVTMPSLDGYELCSLLRRHTLFKQTPIIMVTGNTGLIDRAKAKLVGSSGYLTKPFTQPDLLKVIFKHLT